MQLTRAADYAIRIMVHLATLPPGSRANRGELAEAAEVPEHFVAKILQSLAHSGFIDSQRGMHGGFTLAMSPAQMTLLEVIEAIEGPTRLNVCLAPGNTCPRKNWCPTHCVWQDAQQAMTRVLNRKTIASLAAECAEPAHKR